jgi:hypothetical protein
MSLRKRKEIQKLLWKGSVNVVQLDQIKYELDEKEKSIIELGVSL